MSNTGFDDTQETLTDLSASDLLAYVETQHAHRLQAERNLLKAAYQWAVLHHPDRLPATDKRGRDRAKPAGADGTPKITEHAAAFGARIQTSPYGARRLIADAVDLALRHPKLQTGINTGTVRVAHARHVAQSTRDLTDQEAAWVDAEVVESADGRLGWKRFEQLVEGKVAAAAPEHAKAKERAAALERGVRMSRVNKHGIGTLIIRTHIATLLGSLGGIDALARALEDKYPDTGMNERRLIAFAMLTNPEAHQHLNPDIGPVKPKVKIYLHLTPDSHIARMEDHGPLTTAWVKDLIAHIAGRVTVAPVIDLANQAPVDAYEIPTRLREAVHLIHPADVFPYATNTSRHVDLDHAIPYAEGGPTAIGNLGPMTRTHHRIKTHTGWECRQPFPGIIIWRDPHGAHYLVDATGTRKVTGTPGDQTRTRLEIHTAEFIVNYLAA